MSYKTILAILDTPSNAAVVIDFALALAAEYGAHVIGLHAETLASLPLAAPMDLPDPVAVQAMQDVAHAETRQVEQIFRSRAAASDLSTEWRGIATTTDYDAPSVLESLRSADLLVAAQSDPERPFSNYADIDQLLFESGRPLLLIPASLRAPTSIRRALVAWNGSREAARAVFDALPLLRLADRVEIFSVDPDESAGRAAAYAGAELAAALDRHGIAVSVATAESGSLSPSQVIEKRLQEEAVDLLVMGAYTHSRLWQSLFGGTTRRLLQSMTALTLMSR